MLTTKCETRRVTDFNPLWGMFPSQKKARSIGSIFTFPATIHGLPALLLSLSPSNFGNTSGLRAMAKMVFSEKSTWQKSNYFPFVSLIFEHSRSRFSLQCNNLIFTSGLSRSRDTLDLSFSKGDPEIHYMLWIRNFKKKSRTWYLHPRFRF